MIAHWFPYTRLRREQNCTRFTAFSLALIQGLGWIFLRLESPSWKALREQHRHLYPHLAEKRSSIGDPLRYVVQTLWLLLIRTPNLDQIGRQRFRQRLGGYLSAVLMIVQRPWNLLSNTFADLPSTIRPQVSKGSHWWDSMRWPMRKVLYIAIGILALALIVLCITEPFGYLAQLVFVILLWVLAMLVRRMPGRFPTLLLIALSIIVSCRYLWWRYTSTLNWNDNLDLICGLILLIAETYSWLILLLGYVQTSWPLNRQPAQLPADINEWPVVDLLIPTYNEELSVTRGTVYAALGIDWPKDKLRIHLLDDGNRPSFKTFADEVGINYIARTDNRHAKAGNLNHALTLLDGELVAIFDCDHMPARSFLQLTVGWFLPDPTLALVQTPHHFLSPDPFERNLGTFRNRPNEGELFYGLIQDGNDMWNAAFFCGSCAIVRRTAIDSIGGFAVETVTEDAHTALRLHRNGWTSAYLRIPQAAGLATESLSAHIGQRIRWARGMVQIFRTDNPLLGKGLTIFQRICYTNAMMILLYVLPHMIHASLTNSRMQGAYRQTFWGEVYETVLAWYIARPTTVALFSPSRGKFNVTAKGGMMEENQFDWQTAKPYLVLSVLNVVGLGFAVWRLFTGPKDEIFTVLVSVLWVVYNLLIIGAAVAVAAEVRQVRTTHRVLARLPGAIKLADGHSYPCELVDYSDGGVGVQVSQALQLPVGTQVSLILQRGNREFVFTGTLTRSSERFIGLSFAQLPPEQKIEFVQCTFGRADAWLDHNSGFEADKPIQSLKEILALGVKGYYRLYEYLPTWIRILAKPFLRIFQWLGSFLPRMPKAATPLISRPVSRS